MFPAEHYPTIAVPAYHIGGWYDIFLNGTLRNYTGIKTQGPNEAARHGQRLMIGPWVHGSFDRKAGDADFRPAARIDEIMLRWCDRLLKGVQDEIEKPVKIFIMGINIWHDEDDWPLPSAKDTRFYLHSTGSANTLSGKGLLNAIKPRFEAEDRFTYIPSDPVPTRCGGLCCDTGDYLSPGAFDQRPNESRQDVLVYTTAALDEDVEVTGPVSLDLYANSSTIDTDFKAKLIDVHPDGYAQNLTHGIVRARYRNSQEKAEFMERSQIFEFQDRCRGNQKRFSCRTSHPSGDPEQQLSALRSKSEYCRRTRAPGALGETTSAVYHNREYPSALILPVIQRKVESVAGK